MFPILRTLLEIAIIVIKVKQALRKGDRETLLITYNATGVQDRKARHEVNLKRTKSKKRL